MICIGIVFKSVNNIMILKCVDNNDRCVQYILSLIKNQLSVGDVII